MIALPIDVLLQVGGIVILSAGILVGIVIGHLTK